MNKIRCSFLSLIIAAASISSVSLAADSEKTLEQKLSDLKLEKIQAEVMINKMLKSGRMDKNEAVEARRAIASVQEENAEEIRNKALDKIKSSTNSLATK